MSTKVITQQQESKGTLVPWYLRGGLSFCLNIQICRLNIALPVILLSTITTTQEFQLIIVAWTLHILLAKFIFLLETELCIFHMPSFIIFSTVVSMKYRNPILLGCTIVWGVLKIVICMSCCLHRYCAHTAYKCGPITKYAICFISCLGNQGGPIWWASIHRCHHKHCDLPRDPHSPTQVGFEKAFAFFFANPLLQNVDEEFVPKHMEDPLIHALDTFSFFVVTIEYILHYYFFGIPGLFVAYVSACIAQFATLMFNCAFHPANKPESGKTCKSTNGMSPWKFMDSKLVIFPGFLPFPILSPFFMAFVGENEHDVHHDFPMLAKRDDYDMGWYLFLYPLMKLGLIWDANLPKKKLGKTYQARRSIE